MRRVESEALEQVMHTRMHKAHSGYMQQQVSESPNDVTRRILSRERFEL
jgi:hypothetical protein